MTNITKAAKQALAELADWHWSQAATLRKAACTSAMDKPEPGQSSLTRMADWHDAQKSIIRAALQDKAGEVPDDVARYRAIRDGLVYIEPHESGEIYVAGETGVYTKSGDEFDSAIDAIAASQQKGGQHG